MPVGFPSVGGPQRGAGSVVPAPKLWWPCCGAPGIVCAFCDPFVPSWTATWSGLSSDNCTDCENLNASFLLDMYRPYGPLDGFCRWMYNLPLSICGYDFMVLDLAVATYMHGPYIKIGLINNPDWIGMSAPSFWYAFPSGVFPACTDRTLTNHDASGVCIYAGDARCDLVANI